MARLTQKIANVIVNFFVFFVVLAIIKYTLRLFFVYKWHFLILFIFVNIFLLIERFIFFITRPIVYKIPFIRKLREREKVVYKTLEDYKNKKISLKEKLKQTELVKEINSIQVKLKIANYFLYSFFMIFLLHYFIRLLQKFNFTKDVLTLIEFVVLYSLVFNMWIFPAIYKTINYLKVKIFPQKK